MKDYLEILKNTGLKQSEIAENLGVNVRTLQNYYSTGVFPKTIKKLIDHVFCAPEIFTDRLYLLEKDSLKDAMIKSLNKNVILLEEQIEFLKFKIAKLQNEKE
jgi:transcriptional regulator with XRE-family HTH domain